MLHRIKIITKFTIVIMIIRTAIMNNKFDGNNDNNNNCDIINNSNNYNNDNIRVEEEWDKHEARKNDSIQISSNMYR